MKINRFFFILFSVLSFCVNFSCARKPELIPLELLLGNPEKASAQISPDGMKLSYLAPKKGVINVWIKTLGANDDHAVTHDTNRGVIHYGWTADSKKLLYVQDVGGNENGRLYALDLTNGEIRDLTPFENVQVRIVSYQKDFPDEILIAMNRRDVRLHDVYHLNLVSGEMKLVAENPGSVSGWMADAKLKVRAAVASREDGGSDLLMRDTEESPWRTLVSWSPEDDFASGFLSFSKNGQSIYLEDSRGVDKSRLVRMNVASGETEVLAEDPESDLSDVMFHPDTFEVQMVGFLKDRKEWRILDASIRDDIGCIRALNPGDFSITSRTLSDKKWIVRFEEDQKPVSYYCYDRTLKKGEFLFFHQPALNRYRFSPIKPIVFKARDGLLLHGYLTLPLSKRAERVPLVLMVHGGPWARDGWGFAPRVQWLASRGYACLQINFRGSTGYGKAFVNAANKEWGGKMQDDLVDGVRWAVREGIADPKRVAIFGSSYGGYAALAGAAFTPEVFRCAVSIVGPSNLVTFLKTTPPYWHSELPMIHKRVGNPETEAEFLKSRSPLYHVDRIKVPIFIAQGANDPRVNVAEAEQMVEALKRKGVPYEYVVFGDEGHGFVKAVNRLELFRKVEKFLAQHLR